MKAKKGGIQTGSLGGASGIPHIQVPNTEDMSSQMDIANPDSFIGNASGPNTTQPDTLKVTIDAKGQPMLSPSNAKSKSNKKSRRNQHSAA